MKLFTTAAAFIAILAFACADVSHLGYGYDQPAASSVSNQYIPPAANAPEPAYAPAPVYQSAPAPSYQPAASAPVSSYIPPAATAPEVAYAPAPGPVYQGAASETYEQPAQDGYRYRTVRRRVYKHRRF
ncbi:unnamed protein product [Ceratitis capitata]|uniref:(Mediterranean fruit fly) hypothetical protein n=2 Tax=Ceratitis capitata TaxID=7213 RepID=A0A811VGU9_CERCA|nr:unnamed protein product [Ceratitis capitata]